ncbi:MAG: SDR family oxidoreductase [Solirubrobacteraceae bacterium]
MTARIGTTIRGTTAAVHVAAPVATAESGTILLTGATGYVGGRLLPRLIQEGLPVRCLTRRPELLAKLALRDVEIAPGDLLDLESLTVAMAGVHIAYYLVHSMDGSGNFEELDRRAATNFATAAAKAGVRHIIYLSGLGSGQNLSAHLASRHEVGDILRRSGVLTSELRASIVIGAGSASFETIRAVVERLPAIPAPKWVDTAAQPIAIEDVIEYLLAVLTPEPTRSAVFEIGSRDRVSYAEIMREYAHQRNLRRRVLPVPARTARGWRLFLGMLTPTHGRVAATMLDSLRNETVVSDPAARETFAVTLRGLPEAIERALTREDHEFADTSWRDALPEAPSSPWGGIQVRRRMVTSRVKPVHARPHQAFAPIQRIGGQTGWYGVDWFWRLRGRLDEFRGGDGMRRGRRDPHIIHVGDRIDFWRVERVEPNRRLLLAAEMKIPGRLWLQFDIESDDSRTQIRQTTVFDPAGSVGLIYWYLLYPVHHTIFKAMLQGLNRATQLDPNHADPTETSARQTERRCVVEENYTMS